MADKFRSFGKVMNIFIAMISVSWVLYHLLNAGGYAILGTLQHRAVFLGFGFSLIWLLIPPSPKLKDSKFALIIDIILAILTVVITIYVFQAFQSYNERVGLPPTFWDMTLGIIFYLMIIETARRTLGWIFPSLVILFTIYAFIGPILPEPFTHSGLDIQKMVGSFFISTVGPYGTITGVGANFIFLFIVFAAFIRTSGAGDFFKDFAMSILGTVRGGPAKLAVLASGLMGMVSGSGMANVAGSGSFTIPLMKKSGYKAKFAGGVETVSSMGGQIVPPIMGGSIFIMMELLGVAYWDIVVAVILIAILMYTGLFINIDLEAVKEEMSGLQRSQIPKFWKVIRTGWFHFIPLALLFVILGYLKMSPGRGAFWAIVSIPIIHLVMRSGWFNLKNIINGFVSSARDVLVIVGVLASAGLIAGIVSVSGLGLSLSALLIDLADGKLLLLLILTAIVSLILGLGLPIIVAYVLLALLIAPALIDMGVQPLAAHLFIFYYGLIGAITPPVAPDAFVAAGIAKADPIKIAFVACRLGAVLYLIPFTFVYNPALLMQGSVWEILLTFTLALIGTYCLATGFQGYILYKSKIMMWERIVLLIAAILLIVPEIITGMIGLVLMSLIQGKYVFKELAEKRSNNSPSDVNVN